MQGSGPVADGKYGRTSPKSSTDLDMPAVSYPRLVRLARRSVPIARRWSAKDHIVAAIEPRLVAAATTLSDTWFARSKAAVHLQSTRAAYKLATEELRDCLRAWLPQVRRDCDLPGGLQWGHRDHAYDDLVYDVSRVLDLAELRANGPRPLPYGAAMYTRLLEAQQRAQVAEQAHALALAEASRLVTELRERARTFKRELATFRSTMRIRVGRTHADYRALGVRR